MIPGKTIIGGSSAEHTRHASDFYETPPECTVALLRAWPVFGVIWEPACGFGAISEVLKAHGHAVCSTDIRHTGYGTGGVDMMATMPRPCGAVITNPPFALAVGFIRYIRAMRVPFALLLKGTFWHANKRHALFLETGPAAVMPMLWRPNMAPDRGKSATMEFCWTVWDAMPALQCRYTPLERPNL
jgi:hypothetical protein